MLSEADIFRIRCLRRTIREQQAEYKFLERCFLHFDRIVSPTESDKKEQKRIWNEMQKVEKKIKEFEDELEALQNEATI